MNSFFPIFAASLAYVLIPFVLFHTILESPTLMNLCEQESSTFPSQCAFDTNTPQKSTYSVEKRIDVCMKEETKTLTLSTTQICQIIEGEKKLFSALKWIEAHIASSLSFFTKSEDEKRYDAIIVPNGLCQQASDIDPEDITVATHLTPNKIKRLVAMAERWNGPISASIKISSLGEFRRFCSDLSLYNVQLQNVGLHFFFEDKSRLYPINILRNLALDHVKSNYVAILDVDFLSSPINTNQHLRSIFASHRLGETKFINNTIYVMPAFEVKHEKFIANTTINRTELPGTRESLIEMMNTIDENEKVFIFHEDSYKPGHRSTNYTRWTSNLEDTSYPIEILEFGYEPYIIGTAKSLPRFFEDFRGYGMNKLSYLVQLYYANFRLRVLRDVFVLHSNHPSTYGDQKRKSFQRNLNCSKFFVKFLSQLYGAGNFSDDREIAGWNIWKRLRDRY